MINLHWSTACDAYKEHSWGALLVDTISRPTVEGKPFGYFQQDILEGGEDEDIKRMVKEYDPSEEFVAVLLKTENRTSTYRVKPSN